VRKQPKIKTDNLEWQTVQSSFPILKRLRKKVLDNNMTAIQPEFDTRVTRHTVGIYFSYLKNTLQPQITFPKQILSHFPWHIPPGHSTSPALQITNDYPG